jgi:methylaspartate mutase S subunit
MKKAPIIVTGTVGMDAHVIGTKVVSRALRDAGFNVVELGIQITPEEFIRTARETGADAILMTSMYGMAEYDLQGFDAKRREAGLGDVLIYIAGNLTIGRYDHKEIEPRFRKLGFDRVYPAGTDIQAVIENHLKPDLRSRGKM